MRVKKFEAKSMKEALHMVKMELGPDAVILSARDNRKSFGLAGEASVEITAAVSESTLQKKKFVESRMTTSDRDKFQNSDARTQRAIIEKMVERRIRENEARAQAEAKTEVKPRPITRTSYIDIEDEEMEMTPRRTQAFERAKGRNVSDLLEDFDRDFEPSQAPQPRSQQRQMTQEPRASEQTGNRALSRIKNAAREAWTNNAFMDEEPQPKKPAAPNYQRNSTAPVRAQSVPAPAPVSASSSEGARSALQARIAQAKEAVRPAQPTQASAPSHGGLEMHSETLPAQTVADVASLKGEIQRLQKMLEGFQKVPQTFQQTFTQMHPGAEHGVPYDLSFMYQKLSEAGVSTENIVEILQGAAKEIDPAQAKKRPIVDAWVARFLLNRIHVNPTPFAGRVHLFVGASGSGKTSTLVKMAAQLVVKEKKKVAILSTDSLKVGAVDQMKIYCQILNVPFAVVRSKQDWDYVLSQLVPVVDHILVDFPGLQLRDLDEIHYLKSLLPPEGVAPITHLCVSATTKDGDAYETASRYKVASPNDLVFTNLDQSVQHGVIYNLQKRTGLALHSFGIGHRIPEDYEPASKERVLDLIFKLTKLRREGT